MVETQPESLSLRILVVDDEANIRLAVRLCLEAEGHKVVAVGTIDAALEETARHAFDLIFLDVRLGTQNGLDYIETLLQENPWTRIVVITAYASIETAIDAMKLGATDYLPKPFEPTQLQIVTRQVAERRRLERKVEALQKTLGGMDPEADFQTSNIIWRESIEFARRIAKAQSPVLIRGQSGTGRGRLARAIHEWSGRSSAPFASVSFAGKSVDLLESEIFGTSPETGGKTGAIAFCHGGTLLLEEISNVPMRLQPRLVALIRDKEFERQDQFVRRSVDVRVIATTSADLQSLVDQGKFRDDLLMALNVTQVDIPELRQRSEDILFLAERYLAYFGHEHHKLIAGFSRDAEFVLKSHRWPGNTRELSNVIERAVLLCETSMIDLDHLPPNLTNDAGAYQVGDLVPLETIEEAHIAKVLASAKTLRRAAAILGVNHSALCRKLKRQQRTAS